MRVSFRSSNFKTLNLHTMQKFLFSLLLLASFFKVAISQNPFSGTYNGKYNGDNIVLMLQNSNNNALVGKMTDSQQNYEVVATSKDNQIQGKAVEKNLNLTFILNGQLVDSQLNMQMTLELNGQKQVLDVVFIKQNNVTSATKPATTTPPQKVKFPNGATHDPNLVGMWTKSETYNSGSGDNFMGSNFEQSMVFFADGSVGEGGSRASISGSNYSGYTEGGARALPGVYWYNIGNQLYIYTTENGQTASTHLGRYYIENGAMLITGVNGKKMLLQRK